MSTQIEVMDANAQSNHAAMHSLMVMEQWGDGETYNEATWIERGRHAVRQTLEGMFELGRTLIILKEHTEHGRFLEISEKEFGIKRSEAGRLMSATRRFATPQMQKAAPKLMDLGKSKLLELLVEEDVTLVGLADGEEVNGMTLDDVDRMTVKELRVALREKREELDAKDKVLRDKNAKIDEYAEKLAKKQKSAVKEPEPADIANELNIAVSSKVVAIRSHIMQLGDYFGQLTAHGEAHGLSHQATMVGALNQLLMDIHYLRDQYNLPSEIPEDEQPEWLGDLNAE